MSCENCTNLKIKAFNYPELLQKWNDIYGPTPITVGYEKRLRRECMKHKTPFEEIKMKFVYCSAGMLNRFYIVRHQFAVKSKTMTHYCKYYS
jgi:hypothetical protein